MELAEWEKRRSHTVPAPPTNLGGPGEPDLRGRNSDDVIRKQRQEVARKLAARVPIAGDNIGGGAKVGVAKGLTNGAEYRRKKTKFQRLTERRRKKKESFIRSADFDKIGRNDFSSSDSESDDCFVDEVGGAKGSEFRSLLLFIPLRLGQDKFNMEYKEAVKVCVCVCVRACVVKNDDFRPVYLYLNLLG